MTKGPSFFTKAFLILLLTAFLAAGLISCKKKGPAGDNAEAAEGSVVLTNKNQNPGDPDNSEDFENSEFSFYSPAEDDASWVEPLLLKLEEERIAEELAKMEAEMAEYQLEDSDYDSDGDDTDAGEEADGQAEDAGEAEKENPPEPEKDPVEKFFDEQKEGKAILGKNEEMRFFEFDNEILTPQFDQNGITVIHASGDNVVRNFYNNNYQLVKKEEWLIKSVSDSKKLKTEAFVYSDEGKVREKEIITATYDETIKYNTDSLPQSSRRYLLTEDNKYLIMERQWNYDAKKRILNDYQKEYIYKDSDYKKEPDTLSKKYNYSYNDYAVSAVSSDDGQDSEENKIPPDLKYYENENLKMYNKYTAEKGTWYSWIYFDDNLSVKTYYEDDKRVRDEYFNTGKLFRTKLYDTETKDQNEEGTLVHKEGKK